jgi:hypothetical protein
MANTSNIYIGFSPGNFYYVNAASNGAEFAADDDVCKTRINEQIQCDHDHFIDTSFNCIQQEMCKNKDLALALNSEFNNNGGNIKLEDFQHSYDSYFLRAANLGIGILAMVYIMMNKRNTFS